MSERRAEDPRINKLVEDVSELKAGLAENNKTTEQVRDILTSFRVLATVAKWIAAIGAGYAAVRHGIDGFNGHK